MEDEGMPQKKHKPEENEPLCAIGSSTMANAKLRQVDVLVSQGQSVAEAVRSIVGRDLPPVPVEEERDEDTQGEFEKPDRDEGSARHCDIGGWPGEAAQRRQKCGSVKGEALPVTRQA
jgi:hypothetical protein